MENKFKMTREDNIFWAKRNIVDTIYKNAKLEGINVTFPQTEAIYNGGLISNVSALDVEKVLGMKHAWEFIIDTIGEKLIKFYETNDMSEIKEFLHENAITGFATATAVQQI